MGKFTSAIYFFIGKVRHSRLDAAFQAPLPSSQSPNPWSLVQSQQTARLAATRKPSLRPRHALNELNRLQLTEAVSQTFALGSGISGPITFGCRISFANCWVLAQRQRF